ncbi:urease accessory protein UreD [Methylobrevis albus]|uniref:Urease accessory protein UreD n=1 Tax=Methylobrevis albus TaxID=2793297 RepID=A0A931I0R7_9HYPH|nr:urease accessory protein UreD [Methylobrevis albus]MBH0237215.1 urease accessory protein UreD [Methylobrevis albus]
MTATAGEAAFPLQRARGAAEVTFKAVGGTTRLDVLRQEGCCKVRLPRTHDGVPLAVLINTAGGVTGGDDLGYAVGWGAGTRATATTQAAERIYRRASGRGRIVSRLTIAADAVAEWLPQETIVFDRAGLERRLEVETTASASLTAVEQVVLGRTASGEEVREAAITDAWRVRRDGKLIYADTLRLDGDIRAALAGPATGRGGRAFATILHIAPDAEQRLEAARDLIAGLGADGVDAGASAFDGLLAIRLLAPGGRAIRDGVVRFLEAFRGRSLPRNWSC